MSIKIKSYCFFILLIGTPLQRLHAQKALEDSIYNSYLDFLNSKTEASKIETSNKFLTTLKGALQQDEKATLAFDSLKKYKVMLESPDKKMRIFTWSIRSDDFNYTYYGVLQLYSRKQKKYEVYELKDQSATIKDPENAILDNRKWYGAYYYQIVETKYKNKMFYTLLGWDGNNQNTNKKLIDVLTINDKGFPKFGDAIFSDEKGRIKKRIIFEYKAGIIVSLKYDESREGIVFDHLSPSDPSLEGMYSFYGPDFSYDVLYFKAGKWLYQKDVNPKNDKSKTDKQYNEPK